MPYYREKLSSERLKRVYDIAPPRIRQYLRAELAHALAQIQPHDDVLELGCGYGRLLAPLATAGGEVFGIDNAPSNLLMARDQLRTLTNCHLACMDAARLAFRDASFDITLCLQNGISAFHIDQRTLISEAIRITRRGGLVLFSSYSAAIWPDRLAWFEMQADAGLLGEIDYDRTGDGVIVCKDGFSATTVSPEQFERLSAGTDRTVTIREIDHSSIFCEIRRTTGPA